MIKRDECLKLLAPKIADDEIVVAAFTTAFEWIAIRPSPLNFISSGAMGLTSSHALGFALAWPDRRIILLDGDGSLLMNLGCLVTNANTAPKNLIHFVFENVCDFIKSNLKKKVDALCIHSCLSSFVSERLLMKLVRF